ncbi:hypothetical protein Rs2_07203 [Raphanus sativus]|uniref:Uncharacterized protein LOC108840206 n=1 Tax=Raphanus sativus TaxID=3726 RepID=A0A6J0M830_RAPSA|nr:uncharacterized protein LOC108840206 [Raphanus sativus]KAJ4912582.1 hypothetical protein Rs2_07203 [Raphanus sativus]
MAEEEKKRPTPEPTTLPSPPQSPPKSENSPPEKPTAPATFDPSRMVGIIKRKALIKDLAAAYQAECLSYCRELLDLQKRKDEPFLDTKAPDDLRKEALRSSSKRAKKKR